MKKLLQKLFAFWQRKNVARPNVFRANHRKGLAAGFTLIELLVAALIASVLVSILLSFLVGVLDSDRKETAKSNAQEELQAAISYIADDLQEAIYIYGSESLAGINDQLPHTQATNPSSDCNPTSNTCTPVLVFWKRFSYNPNSNAKYSATPAAAAVEIGCMPYVGAAQTSCVAAPSSYGRDTYTYSLVAYYLKSDDPTIAGNSGSNWSNTARILRWELKDGYVAYCSTGGAITNVGGTITSPTGCPLAANLSVRANSPLIVTPTPLIDSNTYFILPSTGFNKPDFSSAGTLSTLSAAWKKFDNFNFSSTGTPFTTLVDFMDDTTYATTQGGNLSAAGTGTSATAASGIKIPIGKNITILNVASPANPDCDDPSVGVGNPNPASATNTSGSVTQRIPNDFNNGDGTNPSKLSSFYACVTPESVTARIYLRGNAIARLATPPVAKANRLPNTNNITFFPNADVRSFGRSGIGLKKK